MFAGRQSVARIQCVLFAGALAVFVRESTQVAHADENAWQLEVAAGAASLATEGAARWGPTLGAAAQWGLSDTWAVYGGLDGRWQPGTSSVLLGAGLTYTIDVLRWLPFAQFGGATLLSAPGWHSHFGPQVGLGADYLLDRRYSVGAVAKYSYLPLDSGGADATTHVATLALRLSYRLF